jgi:MFS family permease
VLCAADLLVMLDEMVVTVALPAIEEDVGAARGDLQWVVTAYTLSLGAFLLVGAGAARPRSHGAARDPPPPAAHGREPLDRRERRRLRRHDVPRDAPASRWRSSSQRGSSRSAR